MHRGAARSNLAMAAQEAERAAPAAQRFNHAVFRKHARQAARAPTCKNAGIGGTQFG
jgi:hypothetical protein